MNNRLNLDLARPEFDSQLPPIPYHRSNFIAGMLTGGFALATQPVTTQVITTDREGLEDGVVEIPCDDFNMPTYFARPVIGNRFPVVLVAQEIFGIHEYIQDVCRRLAKQGYLAIAPSLHARFGDESRVASMQQIMTEIVARVADEQVMRDLDSTVLWAITNKGDADRLAINGFCWGGRIVWLYAAHQPQLRTGVAWYGKLGGPTTQLAPRNPLALVANIRQPILGLYGEADAGIPMADVNAMRAALKAAGGQSEIISYPDAPHAFHADYRPNYRKAAAEDGWRRMLEWLQANGV